MDSPVHTATLLQIDTYMNVCSLALLIYDSLVTLDMEVKYIWNGKWGIGKVLFLLERYPTFIDISIGVYYSLASYPSNKTCIYLATYAAWSVTLGIGIAEAILIIRTYALWGNSRRILFFLVTVYVCFMVAACTIMMLALHSVEYGSPPIPSVKGCYIVKGSIETIFIDLVLLSVFEIIIMILTIWIGLVRYRYFRNPLVVTLYRDGILYFLWLLLISLGNIIVFVSDPLRFVDLIFPLQRVMHNVLSTRILLHARATVDSSINNPRSLATMSDIQLESLPFHAAHMSDSRTACSTL